MWQFSIICQNVRKTINNSFLEWYKGDVVTLNPQFDKIHSYQLVKSLNSSTLNQHLKDSWDTIFRSYQSYVFEGEFICQNLLAFLFDLLLFGITVKPMTLACLGNSKNARLLSCVLCQCLCPIVDWMNWFYHLLGEQR